MKKERRRQDEQLRFIADYCTAWSKKWGQCTFLQRYMECRHGLAMRILCVCPSISLSKATRDL